MASVWAWDDWTHLELPRIVTNVIPCVLSARGEAKGRFCLGDQGAALETIWLDNWTRTNRYHNIVGLILAKLGDDFASYAGKRVTKVVNLGAHLRHTSVPRHFAVALFGINLNIIIFADFERMSFNSDEESDAIVRLQPMATKQVDTRGEQTS